MSNLEQSADYGDIDNLESLGLPSGPRRLRALPDILPEVKPVDDEPAGQERFDDPQSIADEGLLDLEPDVTMDPLKLYVRQIGDEAFLTRDEERKLAERRDAGDADAVKELVRRNVRLVMWVSKRFTSANIPLLDLIQEGNLGLMRAAEKFNPEYGYKFSTYATWWIWQAVSRALGEHGHSVRLPVHVGEQLNRINRNSRKLEQKLGREPSAAEIAEETGLSEELVLDRLRIAQESISMDTPIGDGESVLSDLMADNNAINPSDELTKTSRKNDVGEALTKINPRLAEVLTARFGLDGREPKTLEEVGKDFGVSRERIRQMETSALKALKRKAPGLKLYLRT